MIMINQCKLPISHTTQELENKIRALLKLKPSVPITWEIRRRSIDARKKPRLFYVYQLWVDVPGEEKLVHKLHSQQIQLVNEQKYHIPSCSSNVEFPENLSMENPSIQSAGKLSNLSSMKRPVIIGAGPAGLFAAYFLTEAGVPPIVIERGKRIEERRRDVENFWKTGILDPSSNVQFGEGGAGTFSDGKLNTAVKDSSGRIRFVLETFARFGAPGDILYEQKPHIGTDILADVITNMRNYLIEKGCEFQFETMAENFIIENGSLRQIICVKNGRRTLFDTNTAILAIGHSARDTFQTLEILRVPMEAKNFAVGFRVEHPQRMIDEAMYGKENIGKLPAAPYKVTSNFPNGRGVYSFCMCPGGFVVNAASEPGMLAVNGMSYHDRASGNANSAVIISVTPADFGASDALAGMRYQQTLEQKCFDLGCGRIPQQLFGDYQNGVCSVNYGDFDSRTKGAHTFANLRGLFSSDMEQSFLQGMEHFAQIIPGFDRPDAILSGVESRTSSPVRILRDENCQSPIKGLYPCGEGAGYAGGIVSAAVDGLRVAAYAAHADMR